MKWSRDKALGLISNWPIDEMILAFDCQEIDKLWEFYNAKQSTSPGKKRKLSPNESIAKKIIECEDNGWISSLKCCSDDDPPETLVCLLWASLDEHAKKIEDGTQLDDTGYRKKERRMLRQVYTSSIENDLSSDDSELVSSRDYDFHPKLLDVLVQKLKDDSEARTDETKLKYKITDLTQDENFPVLLIPKATSHEPPLVMASQGLIPPWVHQIAPKVLELLTLATDSLLTPATDSPGGKNNEDNITDERTKESHNLQGDEHKNDDDKSNTDSDDGKKSNETNEDDVDEWGKKEGEESC